MEEESLHQNGIPASPESVLTQTLSLSTCISVLFQLRHANVLHLFICLFYIISSLYLDTLSSPVKDPYYEVVLLFISSST